MIITIVTLILLIIFESFLYYWFGYFTGWLASITIGSHLINAINITFGTEFTVAMLPYIGGALGWIGSFFRSTHTTKYNNKK